MIAHWSYQRAITDAELAGAVDGMRPHVEALVALVQGDDPLIAARALAALEEVIALARYTTEPLAVIPRPPERAPAHPDRIEGVIRLGLREAAAEDALSSDEPGTWSDPAIRLPRAIEAIGRSMPGIVARLAVEEAELLSLRFPDRAVQLFQYAGQTFERLGCTVEAQVARLGWAACRQMLGIRDAAPPDPVVPALAGLAAWVSGPGGSFPLVERTRVRRPPLLRRARAWARRYSDELLLALGLGVGSIAVVIGWLALDFVALPLLRNVVAIPETPIATATAFLIASGALLLFRARNLRALRNSALWRSMQALRPWRYRLALRVLDDREGLRIVIERRDRRQTWLVPQPGAGDIPLLARTPDDLAALAEVRDEIERESPLPVTARRHRPHRRLGRVGGAARRGPAHARHLARDLAAPHGRASSPRRRPGSGSAMGRPWRRRRRRRSSRRGSRRPGSTAAGSPTWRRSAAPRTSSAGRAGSSARSSSSARASAIARSSAATPSSPPGGSTTWTSCCSSPRRTSTRPATPPGPSSASCASSPAASSSAAPARCSWCRRSPTATSRPSPPRWPARSAASPSASCAASSRPRASAAPPSPGSRSPITRSSRTR